jgi:hypothetical protein
MTLSKEKLIDMRAELHKLAFKWDLRAAYVLEEGRTSEYQKATKKRDAYYDAMKALDEEV